MQMDRSRLHVEDMRKRWRNSWASWVERWCFWGEGWVKNGSSLGDGLDSSLLLLVVS